MSIVETQITEDIVKGSDNSPEKIAIIAENSNHFNTVENQAHIKHGQYYVGLPYDSVNSHN